MLFDPARHEALHDIAWDEDRVRAAIAHIVRDTEARFSPDSFWPLHPRDANGGETAPAYPLYHGAFGVVWALQYLTDIGAARASRSFDAYLEPVRQRIRDWLASFGSTDFASYMMGETSVLLLRHVRDANGADTARLEELIGGNVDNPTRELMWGSPGTMLAALFMHQRTGDARWAELFRMTASKLWSQLLWSSEHECHYWTQDMYGQQSTYIDAVHGFVATASALIRGRHLLSAEEWPLWEQCIVNTVERTATWDGRMANWRAWLDPQRRPPHMLMQYCHGAPGFIVCLAGMTGTSLDNALIAGGEATWTAGPLTKGSNLCHGTAGNGYAFLKLFQRTGDAQWLDRARAFAMHAIAQTEADERSHGRLRYSLWTGDPGLAIYLWDCVRGVAEFPTLDVFFAARVSDAKYL